MDKIILKSSSSVEVYQNLDDFDVVYKKYCIDYDTYRTREELKTHRQKLMSIKKCSNWPDFVIKPKEVLKLNQRSFVVSFPFIDGTRLDDYLLVHNIDLLTCAKFISNLERDIMSQKDFVFPDIANCGNILILSNDNEMKYFIIDPDAIQFDGYKCTQAAALLSVYNFDGQLVHGLAKCFDDEYTANKQLDIRSIYSLFYLLLNGKDYFYPILDEKCMEDYIGLLTYYNIPKGSSLYKNSLSTLSDDEPSKLISDSLYELIDAGYDFEIYDKNYAGNQYRLTKKRLFY